MARVHLFAGPQSNSEKRARAHQQQHHSQDHEFANLSKRGPSPVIVPATLLQIDHPNNNTLDVTTTTTNSPREELHQQQQQQPDAASIATLTAILQNAQAAALSNGGDINEVVGVVAAHLSAKPDTVDKDDTITTPTTTPSVTSTTSATTTEQQLLQSLLRAEEQQHHDTSNIEKRKKNESMEWIDQATAATALQMLGLSHQDPKPSQPDRDESHSASRELDNVMLIAEYPGLSTSPSPSTPAALTIDSSLDLDDPDQSKRGTWTAQEDEVLIAGIKRFGYGRWKEIANLIPGRKGKQLKQRWDNSLASKFVDTDWIRQKIRGDEEEWQHDIDVEGSAPPSPSIQQQENKEDPSLSSSSSAAAAAASSTLSVANGIMQKITEKAKEGNHEAIEALLSQALLGITNSGSNGGSNNKDNNNTNSTGTPSSGALPIEHTINFADAAALALYAQQFSQQRRDAGEGVTSSSPSSVPPHSPVTRTATTSTSTPTNSSTSSAALTALANHPYFLPFSQAGNGDTNSSSAAAVAAAVAAMAASQQGLAARTPPKPAPRATPGHKRRRSDPALADTQSAAMSIYASAAPITTTINNQTQTVYPCLFPNCGKTFARLYNLKSHSRTHTDDRPFICEVCQTAFSRNHDLKRHAKIHGGDKPHKCLGCNKTFSRLDALKRHKSNLRNKTTCVAP